MVRKKKEIFKHTPDGITYMKPNIYKCINCGKRYSIENREEECELSKNE